MSKQQKSVHKERLEAALQHDTDKVAAAIFRLNMPATRRLHFLRLLSPEIKSKRDAHKLRVRLRKKGILRHYEIGRNTQVRICPFFQRPCHEVNAVRPICRAYHTADHPESENSAPHCALLDRDLSYYVSPILEMLRLVDKGIRGIESRLFDQNPLDIESNMRHFNMDD